MKESTSREWFRTVGNNSEFIHYGDDTYRPELVTKERSVVVNNSKPKCGLWGSPVDSDWQWKHWCQSEEWEPKDFDWSKSFTFTLRSNARILYIEDEEDILDYIIPDEEMERLGRRCIFGLTCITDSIDFDRLYKEYDGMIVIMSENWSVMHYSVFYTWDCDSIVVWNQEVIEVL